MLCYHIVYYVLFHIKYREEACQYTTNTVYSVLFLGVIHLPLKGCIYTHDPVSLGILPMSAG